MVVVLSGSMEPGFYRGDILFLYQPRQPPQTGDISAFSCFTRCLPACRRRQLNTAISKTWCNPSTYFCSC